MQAPPTQRDEQIQWLVDRAAIADVLTALAHRADTKDYAGMADLFTDDGYIVVPYGDGRLPATDLAEITRQIFTGYGQTHHMLGNVEIEIDGDTATSHHYVLATHVIDPSRPSEHADIGAWYDNDYRRTEAGWKLHKLDLIFVYADNLMFEPGDPTGAGSTTT
jgi:uncharacterized protein (TIGR02246 family)